MPEGDLEFIDKRVQRQLIDERQLICRLLEQRSEAWGEFVVRFQHLIYARVRRVNEEYALRLSDVDVEDVCADVFAGLLDRDMAALRSFEHRCRLTTWLSLIARRAALKFARRRNARSQTAADAAAEPWLHTEPAQRLDSLQRLVDAEQIEELRRQFARLKNSDRQVLEMFYQRDLSYKEIGQAMGISVNAVGPKLHRAEQRLKKLLEKS